MKERVFIHTISVYRPAERHAFQVKLPKDAKRIKGIEFTHTIPPFSMEYKSRYEYAYSDFHYMKGYSFNILPNYKVGDIKLEGNDRSGIFLSQEIIHQDYNLLYGSFASVVPRVGEFWTEGRINETLAIDVDGENTILSGLYRDRILEQFQTEYFYKVNLYFYYEVKEKEAKA